MNRSNNFAQRKTKISPKDTKSSRIYASNDIYIELLVNDSNYRIHLDGTIETLNSKSGRRSKVWRRLTVCSDKYGYQYIRYRHKALYVHRIIYRKFLNNPPLDPNLVVHHKDRRPNNNRYDNLELVTQSKNNKYAYKQGKRPVRGNTKLSFTIAEEIRKDHKDGLCYRDLSKKYEISKSHVSYIINGKIWR